MDMDKFVQTEKIYTILELNRAIRGILKREFPHPLWLCGEIQDFRPSRNKRHIYFSLVQKHPEADEVIAKVNVALFEGRKSFIFKRLSEEDAPFELKNDIEVKVLCEVDLYPKTGNFSVIVVDIDPFYTMGKIAQGRQRIIEELKKKGLLEKNKERSIPAVPLRIGLITAFHSAAYHDFINELTVSGYGFKVCVYNCHMQGELVEGDVMAAVRFFNSVSSGQLDVVVITRGGGSTADLSWFDNKNIAEAIATSRFPVLSALGHQINITIADIVAHTSLKTPTKVAQSLVNMVREFLGELGYLEEQISQRSARYIADKRKELASVSIKIDGIMPRYFRVHREELLTSWHRIRGLINVFLMQEKQGLLKNVHILKLSLSRTLNALRAHTSAIEQRVKLLDPANVLKRGYSVTYYKGILIKSIDEGNVGDIITTVLFNGKIHSQIKEKEEARE